MDVLLSLRNVSLSFPRGRRHVVSVLSNVSLDVRAGELVAVLAQRAHGKTTLLRVAAGLDRPGRGEVLFKGVDLWRVTDKRRSEMLRYHIGFAEPGGPDLELPVLTYLALSMFATLGKRAAYKHARVTLARVDATDLGDQLWTSLSDSERALVALAQGIVSKPALLLVDDVTATLGIDAKKRFGRLLRSIAHEDGLAVLMSVSNADATTWCDRIATLSSNELLLPPEAPGSAEKVIDFPSDHPRRAHS
jgi:ABC-type lipoprotein export system ATPase subunit